MFLTKIITNMDSCFILLAMLCNVDDHWYLLNPNFFKHRPLVRLYSSTRCNTRIFYQLSKNNLNCWACGDQLL